MRREGVSFVASVDILCGKRADIVCATCLLDNVGLQDKTDSITISMEKLQYYEESFLKIQEATGIGTATHPTPLLISHLSHATPCQCMPLAPSW